MKKKFRVLIFTEVCIEDLKPGHIFAETLHNADPSLPITNDQLYRIVESSPHLCKDTKDDRIES